MWFMHLAAALMRVWWQMQMRLLSAHAPDAMLPF
jgi:hypothetical protein